MPHVIVKLFSGRTEEQKHLLTQRIAEAVVDTLHVEDKVVTVAFEECSKENWEEEVYIPDIIKKENTLYKKPGYKPE